MTITTLDGLGSITMSHGPFLSHSHHRCSVSIVSIVHIYLDMGSAAPRVRPVVSSIQQPQDVLALVLVTGALCIKYYIRHGTAFKWKHQMFNRTPYVRLCGGGSHLLCELYTYTAAISRLSDTSDGVLVVLALPPYLRVCVRNVIRDLHRILVKILAQIARHCVVYFQQCLQSDTYIRMIQCFGAKRTIFCHWASIKWQFSTKDTEPQSMNERILIILQNQNSPDCVLTSLTSGMTWFWLGFRAKKKCAK